MPSHGAPCKEEKPSWGISGAIRGQGALSRPLRGVRMAPRLSVRRGVPNLPGKLTGERIEFPGGSDDVPADHQVPAIQLGWCRCHLGRPSPRGRGELGEGRPDPATTNLAVQRALKIGRDPRGLLGTLPGFDFIDHDVQLGCGGTGMGGCFGESGTRTEGMRRRRGGMS